MFFEKIFEHVFNIKYINVERNKAARSSSRLIPDAELIKFKNKLADDNLKYLWKPDKPYNISPFQIYDGTFNFLLKDTDYCLEINVYSKRAFWRFEPTRRIVSLEEILDNVTEETKIKLLYHLDILDVKTRI